VASWQVRAQLVDMIFAVRYFLKKWPEQNRDLYINCVDRNKVLDTMSHDSFWKVITKLVHLDKSIGMIRQFHESMQSRVFTFTS